MTNFSSWETIGPLELVYSTAEGILDAVQGATHMHTISDFIHMVQWREPFILTLLALQFLIFTLAYTTRNSEFAHIVVLLLIVSITFAAEHLNDYGRTHWMSFASQNYFDTSGVFMLVFVTAPFVVLVNFIVIGRLLRLVKIYGQARALQMRYSQRPRPNQATSTTSTNSVPSVSDPNKKSN